jgi:hypothetical protein
MGNVKEKFKSVIKVKALLYNKRPAGLPKKKLELWQPAGRFV